jgi:hypothetical protein
MYTPLYTNTGELLAVKRDSDSACIPVAGDNSDWQKFLLWLGEKTLEQWLAENPYQPWGDKTLEQYKLGRINELDEAVRAYVYGHYAQHRQVTLTKLQMDATKNNNIEAYSYIESCWDWIKSAFAVYYVKAAELNACASSEAVNDVSWDLSVLDASDPGVTIQHAMELLTGN